MGISGIGQNYYHNNVATARNTKNVNSTGKNDGFAGKVTEKNPVSPEDMTFEEYKAYFNEKMDALYTHPSQRNMNWVIDITDAAYKRMQTEPEYEQKILDALAKNKAVDFGSNIPQIAYTHVDGTWEGCYGYTKGMKENDSYIKGNSSKHENNVKKEKERSIGLEDIDRNDFYVLMYQENIDDVIRAFSFDSMIVLQKIRKLGSCGRWINWKNVWNTYPFNRIDISKVFNAKRYDDYYI